MGVFCDIIGSKFRDDYWRTRGPKPQLKTNGVVTAGGRRGVDSADSKSAYDIFPHLMPYKLHAARFTSLRLPGSTWYQSRPDRSQHFSVLFISSMRSELITFPSKVVAVAGLGN